jgi:ATP-dependent Clp protease ATP-binding subunit ClpC
MSEFMERHSTARLVGSPPGYVGYDEGGQLTEAVRRRPYSVVLLDEVEKAHPEVFNMLLQILEDGRLSDAKGKAVNFANTIVIMTSNLGVAGMGESLSMGFQPSMPDDRTTDQEHKKMRTRILDELKKSFRPEFLNRLDAVVVFKRLTPPEMRQIVDLMVVRIGKHLVEMDLKLEISDKAKDKIAEEGFDKVYGARPMRRVIQRVIEDPLSEELLRFKYKAGDTVLVDVGAGGEIELGQVTGKPAKAAKEPKEPKESKEAAATAAPATPTAPSTKTEPES